MPKSAEYRARKYASKMDPTVIGSRFTAVKDLAVEQTNAAQAQLAAMESQVRTILASHAIPTWQNPAYLNAARQMWRKSKNFTGDTLVNEIVAIIDGWAAKGLNRDILVEIASIFGVVVPGYGGGGT